VSPEQLGIIGTIVVPVLALLVKVWFEVRSIHHLVNSRMTELLELTRASSRAAGKLEGTDASRPIGIPESPQSPHTRPPANDRS